MKKDWRVLPKLKEAKVVPSRVAWPQRAEEVTEEVTRQHRHTMDLDNKETLSGWSSLKGLP